MFGAPRRLSPTTTSRCDLLRFLLQCYDVAAACKPISKPFPSLCSLPEVGREAVVMPHANSMYEMGMHAVRVQGEGLIPGGLMVLRSGSGGVVYAHQEQTFGDHAPTSEVRGHILRLLGLCVTSVLVPHYWIWLKHHHSRLLSK